MEKYFSDIIIIGGGAAGLMAAAGAAEKSSEQGHSLKVTVLEKMPKPGRKIMITGKGRCNFTNLKFWNEFSGHIHPKPGFLKPAFFNLTSEEMIGFLRRHGMDSIVERGDRVFPESHLASDVVDTLSRAAEEAGARIICGKSVSSLTVSEEGSSRLFNVLCKDGDMFICSKVIVATGGLSYPTTGSTGDGYEWAREMGHSIRPLFPSLTAIVPRGYKDTSAGTGHIDRRTALTEIGKALCGNSLKNIGLTLIIDGNEAQHEFGDLDFTDGGIEGPSGFKVSRKCVNAIINGSKVSVVIDLKPAVEAEDISRRINGLWEEISKDRRNSGKPYKDRYRILLGKLLPMSLIPAFSRLNPTTDHKKLAAALKNWRMDIAGYVGYERCVITAGGISLSEVAPKTLESKLISGIYFAGEILDLDADTGGYNLQTAFSTGYLAGISAAKSAMTQDGTSK